MVSIATMGLFRDCCGGGPGGGGGAVPGVQGGQMYDNTPRIYAKVKNLDIESKNISLSKIKVVLKQAGE